MGTVPAPKWGAGTSPIFFFIQNIKFGWSKDAPSMEYIRSVHKGASTRGQTVGKVRIRRSFIRSLDGVNERT